MAIVAGLATASLSLTAHAQALAPHTSWSLLPWSNGRGAGAYDVARTRTVSFKDHLFQRTVDRASRELAFDAYPGLRVAGQNQWLGDRPASAASYDDGRGIVRVTQAWNGVRVTQSMWSPYDVDAAVTVTVFEVENTTGAALVDAALFQIDNFHVGSGGAGTAGERIVWANGAYEERGEAGLVLQRPSGTGKHAASPQNPYLTVTAGNRLTDVADSGPFDDAVAGFEWDLSGLPAGETRRFMLVVAHRADGDRAALDAQLAAIPVDPAAALAAARAEWDAFFARAKVPDGLSVDELAVYRQQLAILRMGQVRADGPGSGQIIASMPTGMWNVAWVRDQAYATMALVHAGLAPEAKAALAFWWTASTGQYVCCDRDGGPWVGTAYAPSVVRYTGDGVEESDANAQGPNVEFDGFGLALAATADYVDATDDLAFVTTHATAIFTKTADVLVSLIEASGANEGLVRADSSIWETHWYDGGRKHFAYTQITAVHGLRRAADLADRVNRSAEAATYRAAADRIAATFAARFLDGAGAIQANLEEPAGSALDAAAVEALNWDVVPATGRVADATLDAFRAGLWNTATGHGYHRNDDGGPYDRREWIVIDLRIATAARRAGRVADADALIAWVTEQARLNYDLVPENFDRVTADYSGEVPMVGFGAGAYVMSLWDRGAPAPGGPDAGPDPGTPPGAGCCSTSTGTGGPGALLLTGLVGWALRRAKRPYM
ncbi:MAG: glycoside hydrolase family 15 protein [Proteobacteria bacterium]|nr:glycoside hydrolase family 15 protein [Pseudomonadota bacterium]